MKACVNGFINNTSISQYCYYYYGMIEKFFKAYHYRKYCANNKKGCHIVQHYGYFTDGSTELSFDLDWEDHKYFVSTQETAVELQML